MQAPPVRGLWTADGLRQSGYSVLLVPVMLLHQWWLMALVQHLRKHSLRSA